MKFLTTLSIFIGALLVSSCNLIGIGEKGNGNVIKQNRNVASFSKLTVNGVFHVIINQGEMEAVVVETDENLAPLITTDVKDGELTLDLKKGKNIRHSTKLNIYVTIKNIDELAIEGVNQVSSSLLKLPHLMLKSDGVGNNDLQLNCEIFNAHLSGVGSTKLSGNADSATIHNSGVGSLQAFGFIVQKLNIDNSGVGSAEVDAEQQISINNSGVGSVKHKGNATIKAANNDGVGKIKKE